MSARSKIERKSQTARATALAALLACAGVVSTAESPPPTPPFHTDPACWTEPRIVHTGTPTAERRERVTITRQPRPDFRSEGERSPNGAYRVWTRNPSIRDAPPRTANLIVDVERSEALWIGISDIASPVTPTWVNEKLLLVRAWWTREIGVDLLIDVEAGAFVYQEEIDAGRVAFEQSREACGGQCPCRPATH